MQLGVGHGKIAHQLLETTCVVEHADMCLGTEKALVLVLTMQIDKVISQILDEGQRGGGVVDEGT